MCAILISKVLRLAHVKEDLRSFTCINIYVNWCILLHILCVCVCICACLYMQIHKLEWNFAVIIDVRCRLISVIHWDTCWLLCETTTGSMFEALSLLRSAPENFEGFVWCYTVTNLHWRTVWLWFFAVGITAFRSVYIPWQYGNSRCKVWSRN